MASQITASPEPVANSFDISPPLVPSPASGSRKLIFELRGTRLEFDRQTLMSLPESILLIMFPDSILPPHNLDDFEYEDIISNQHEPTQPRQLQKQQDPQAYYIDFDPAYLKQILQFYERARTGRRLAPQQQVPLPDRIPILILREELDYYIIGNAQCNSSNLKRHVGSVLLENRRVFDALERNMYKKEGNSAEQHLIDLLCVSGFSHESQWDYRSQEPTRTSICSLKMAVLRADMTEKSTTQKLFLFWKKPAKKTWWDGTTIELESTSLRVWMRRTWTLELCLV
ncbi:uncharacterized protein VTP21DRAFT_5090 [Calcarisporiella thermophila]|uniref:uncharacterized protein n=1 Tax=Calcarisporiella thermophila TaxID=911321 RepID=UPI00374459FD